MKKILMILLSLMLVVGLVGAGTIAHFSDTETSVGNTFTAGTLDLTVGGVNDPHVASFTLADLRPGSSGTQTYVLANAGSIPGFVDLQAVSVANAGGATNDTEFTVDPGNLGNLGHAIQVTVTVGGTQVYTGSLNDFAGNHDANVSLPAGETTDVAIAWSIPTTVKNEIQGDIATVGITFELAQTEGQ